MAAEIQIIEYVGKRSGFQRDYSVMYRILLADVDKGCGFMIPNYEQSRENEALAIAGSLSEILGINIVRYKEIRETTFRLERVE